jgi:hypothetical protein
MNWYMLLENGGSNAKKLWLAASKADTCLFIKHAIGDEPLSFVIIYVDEGIIGTTEATKEVIEASSKSFKVKTMDEMRKFVGCHVIDTTDRD